ncbi:Steadiness box [Penicillium cf. griseofulvum]|uniref:Steadiness box n=1 Tax=Penicillium cf. griseofulvum TaxID=2972120 RepID=A0A9W9N1C5_9EURO|nr:Steadiness box [Penicillium cf. griseofulvum]KAJ5428927.1 Steadiness box [Penicillium cf. griseofulvum]
MALPQRTLNWLYSVLSKDHYDPQQTYRDPNRTYHDVVNALSQYPSLSPRTDVYTYETGFSALLLHLVGTLPVTFRGTTYRFPIALWIPNTYPRDPPIAYVTPTQEMTVRVGQHVTLEGQVYHHYLAHWAEAWDRSTIADFLSILQDVFAKEPPVRYRQVPQPQPEAAQTPPPLPPLPPGVGSSRQAQPLSPSTSQNQIPPPPPPKPGAAVEHRQQQQRHPADQYRSPPPLPPLPPKDQGSRQAPLSTPLASPGIHSYQHYAPPSQTGGPMSNPRPLSQPSTHQPAGQPMPPQSQGQAPYYRNSGASIYHGSGSSISNQVPQQANPAGAHLPLQPQLPHQPYQQPSGPPYPQHSPYPSNYPRPPPAAPRKADTPDLLTSPFEVELPSITPAGPAPPIPPNPEKDALLHAVSRTLAETLRANAAQSDTAAQSLVSQSRSLHAAMATLQGEVSVLNNLHATLQSNTTVLQQSIHRADATIADAQARSTSISTSSSHGDTSGLPPIDDVLVAPTVVGKQLYDLVAEEQGIQQALYALQAALVRGVIGVDSWSRHTRSLAREALLKRALIRKIGRGMGLDENVA